MWRYDRLYAELWTSGINVAALVIILKTIYIVCVTLNRICSRGTTGGSTLILVHIGYDRVSYTSLIHSLPTHIPVNTKQCWDSTQINGWSTRMHSVTCRFVDIRLVASTKGLHSICSDAFRFNLPHLRSHMCSSMFRFPRYSAVQSHQHEKSHPAPRAVIRGRLRETFNSRGTLIICQTEEESNLSE